MLDLATGCSSKESAFNRPEIVASITEHVFLQINLRLMTIGRNGAF